VKDHPRELRPLCELVASEESNDAGRLLHALAVAKLDEIMPKLQGFITPHFKHYPVATAIDLMLATETSPFSMRKLIPREQLPGWLLSHQAFTVSDVEIVTRWDTELWASQDVAVQMFMRSGPPDKMRDVMWMHDRPPARFVLSPALTSTCMEQIAKADASPESFRRAPDANTTRDPYFFIRFFTISLSDPKALNSQTMEILVKSISDDCEHVSAAAMQCFGLWAWKHNFPIPSEVIFRTASRATKGRQEVTGLAKCLLQVFGKNSGLAGTILQHDFDVRFARADLVRVKRDPMIFSHVAELITLAVKIDVYDDLEAHFVIGCILNYFENGEEELPVCDQSA
jgi:hypothetical protein